MQRARTYVRCALMPNVARAGEQNISARPQTAANRRHRRPPKTQTCQPEPVSAVSMFTLGVCTAQTQRLQLHTHTLHNMAAGGSGGGGRSNYRARHFVRRFNAHIYMFAICVRLTAETQTLFKGCFNCRLRASACITIVYVCVVKCNFHFECCFFANAPG